MIRIVMVDDHALVRAGLRMILEKQADIEVVGEADDGEAGLQLIRNLQPDLALVDLHMPNVNGIEVTERVRRSKLVTRIVRITMRVTSLLRRTRSVTSMPLTFGMCRSTRARSGWRLRIN